MTFQAGSDRHIRGMQAEEEFKILMEANGYKVTKSTPYEDKRLHIDFRLHKDGEYMAVDVKGLKKVAGRMRADYTWVEVVNQYGKGWLYAEHVTHFAFQQGANHFLLVSKEKLQEVVESKYANAKEHTKDLRTIMTDPQRYCYSRRRMGDLPALHNERVIIVKTSHFKEDAMVVGEPPKIRNPFTSFR